MPSARASKQHARTLLLLLATCFLATTVLASIPAPAEEQATPAPEEGAAKPPSTPADTFTYVLTGRPDPFLPFIEPQIATKLNPDEIVEEESPLTGMQLFEPGQLKLVAVLFSNDKKMAMVEDVTGKGYVINEGIPIGRHGVVSEIDTNQVVITETTRTRAGKEIVNTTVMRLNKEGDK
jgi:type IV pilus assembly protein PilP